MFPARYLIPVQRIRADPIDVDACKVALGAPEERGELLVDCEFIPVALKRQNTGVQMAEVGETMLASTSAWQQ